MTKENYILRQRRIQTKLMNLYTQQVYNSLQEQIGYASGLVKSHGIQYAAARFNEKLLNTSIGPIITSLYQSAAALANKSFEVKAGAQMGTIQSFIDDVLDYLKRFLLDNVVLPISQTTTDFIERTLQKAIAEGWGVEQTLKQLEDTDITKNRARMIVRTETVRAINYTQLAAADDKDFEVEKQWIAIEDARTRHSHHEVDGERIGLFDHFTNGLMVPGDPEAPADEVINCRCTLGYFYKRDLEGNLIPKPERSLGTASMINLANIKKQGHL